MTRPLSAVLTAIEAGAGSRADVARRTGLDPQTVDAALDHLIIIGRLEREPLDSGCPDGGCAGCSSGRSDGTPGCGTAAPGAGRGPVLLKLVRRR